MYHYSQDQSLAGYVDFSLSYIDMRDIDAQSKILPSSPTCRYPNFMTGPAGIEPYSPNIKFWHILFARLLFVILFVLVIVGIVTMVRKFIPDVPSSLKYRIRRETFVTTQFMVEEEKKRRVATASRKRKTEQAASSLVQN